jgi:predicted metal-dependent hydrolase
MTNDSIAPRTAIEPRDLRFDLSDVPKAWHGGQLSVSVFFDALSVFFPEGERFFVKSVKAFKDDPRVDVGLKAEAAAFCAQEGHHGREHDRYNDMLRAQSFPVDALESHVVRLLKMASWFPKRRQLAITCALEHFTSLLGVLVLSDPAALQGAHPTMAKLWRWHSAEENEHKAVAFDVYKAVGGSWLVRAWSMLVVTMSFWIHVVLFHLRFMHAAGILFSLREHAALFRYLFMSPSGGLHTILVPYLRYYAPSFHPNEIDSRPLVDEWKEGYAP